MNALTSASFPNGAQCDRSELEARASRPISMLALMQRGAAEAVKADPRPLLRAPCNHPLTRKDEADMSALVNAVLCGGDITNIGDERGATMVVSDEALVGDPYSTRYVQEVRKL